MAGRIKKKRTEADMLALLERRCVGQGRNGDAEAFMTHVRNSTGWARRERTLDAISMSLWPSRGLLMTGYEVKCSRADWLSEMRNPEKSENFVKIMDKFYLVTADDTICQPGELPETWGLLVAQGNRLVAKKEAPKLDPEPMDRLMMAGLLRSAVKIGDATPEEITTAVNMATEQLRARHKQETEREARHLEELRTTVKEFEEASGVRLSTYKYADYTAAEVGAALRTILQGEYKENAHFNRLSGIYRTATEIAQQIEKTFEENGEDLSASRPINGRRRMGV